MNKRTSIGIKTDDDLNILRDAGKILFDIFEELKCSLKIGITTIELDQVAEGLIKKNQVKPAFKGYRGYPACVCTSINEEVVHGIPKDKAVQSGDILSLDLGIIYKDYYADMAYSVGIGSISEELQRLLIVTEKALMRGIEQVSAGNHLSDISHAVQSYAEDHGFSVVRDFVGHGIGRFLHEEPEIPNFGPPHQGPILKPGMVFCVEPMVNVGDWKTKILDDGWTVVTEDGKASAHFEHMIAVTEKGPKILTVR
ncbi:MAG: type I methionyl aminopeptidase [Candidatus Omnitrophica bacterium]|nr:type I methionyl aminopeptidase [Candidatus Omnitrophota bacterium]